MTERVVTANGVELWTEDLGKPEDPPVLLIMGATGQGIYWADEFCSALVEGGRYVIRYDHRDTGQSTCVDFSESPYSVHDLACDAMGVLDAYGISAAHLVGASMGGMIAQEAALAFPERVLSLSSLSSSPLSASVMLGTVLPGPEPVLLEALMAAVPPGPTATREEHIEGQLVRWRALTGVFPFDEQRQRRLEERAFDRAHNPSAATNHVLAMAASPDRTEALGKLTTPTLVIHGTADPLVPYEHGVATAKAVPGAKLVGIEGMGHGMAPEAVTRIAEAILEHTA